jgi:hydroxymethylglutaryl-CoA lyase
MKRTFGANQVPIPKSVGFVEVGPRDGLQNEHVIVPTHDKIELINRAIAAGVKRIEVASFVRADLVPQMADGEDVVRALPDNNGVSYIGLVLNQKGAKRALDTKVHELGAVATATDSFGKRNQGQTQRQSVDVSNEIVRMAREAGRKGQTTISVAFGCPFEGEVPPQRVIDMAKRLTESQPIEIAIADTIGVAVPAQVSELVARVKEAIAPIPVRVHFHNTRNTGLANVWAAFEAGAQIIDASIGGLGGCPFAPKATGNVPSEDVAYLLARSGVATGLDLAKLIETANWFSEVMGRPLPGMVSRAGAFPPPAMVVAGGSGGRG